MLQIHHDLPVPQPKDGEVVVRNSMAGVNYIDVYVRRLAIEITSVSPICSLVFPEHSVLIQLTD